MYTRTSIQLEIKDFLDKVLDCVGDDAIYYGNTPEYIRLGVEGAGEVAKMKFAAYHHEDIDLEVDRMIEKILSVL